MKFQDTESINCPNFCSVTNIPNVGKFLSFCVDVVRIVKNASENIFKLGIMVRVALYKHIFFFNDENIILLVLILVLPLKSMLLLLIQSLDHSARAV
jgi:hypothetical protein